MTPDEKLIRDIEALRESIRRDWQDVARGLAPRSKVIEHIQWCMKELNELCERLSEEQAK